MSLVNKAEKSTTVIPEISGALAEGIIRDLSRRLQERSRIFYSVSLRDTESEFGTGFEMKLGMFFRRSEVGSLAPIAVESPQRNKVERGLGTESGESVSKLFYRFASKNNRKRKSSRLHKNIHI